MIRLEEFSTPCLMKVIREVRPEALIHTAAEGSVDAVEGRLDDHRWLNVDLPGQLAAQCADTDAAFVHVSSNAVFGGSKKPYGDSSVHSPISDYGRLKAAAEVKVLETNPRALIARPILMYGWPFPGSRRNPVAHWVTELRQGRTVRVVDDVVSEPLSAEDCARAIWQGLDLGLSGPCNMSGGEPLTLFNFAQMTCEVFGLDASGLEQIHSSSLPGLAPRPPHTQFDLVRLRSEFGIEPVTLREGLQRMAASEPKVP